MIDLDWEVLALGFAAGAAAGGFYFAGLAVGIRFALRSVRTHAVLLLSAALRIAVVLTAGWQVAQTGREALGGYALAFLLTRFAAIALGQPRKEPSEWN